MEAGEENEVEYAIVYTHDTNVVWNSNAFYQAIASDVRDVKSHFASNNFASCYPFGVGIGEKEVSGIIVYPVPASNTITIELMEPADKIKGVKIFDASGRVVKEERVAGGSKAVINTAEFENGIYFIQTTEGMRPITKKLIIQH